MASQAGAMRGKLASKAPTSKEAKKMKKEKKLKKEKKTDTKESATKKRKKAPSINEQHERDDVQADPTISKRTKVDTETVASAVSAAGQTRKKKNSIPDLRFILAPMVGASELAFRLLCRKYGATLAYTPMMDAQRFAHDLAYQKEIFQTTPEDRPLVCHFSANTPQDFADAAVASAPYCDAIDLNLGCPQRTAFVGHFGSYLLGKEDRSLIVDMIRAATKAAPTLPVCVKIRLLDEFAQTLELVTQLHKAGASWIAIHARYRATWDRKGPGARDGPALLDQVAKLRQMLPSVGIIANGNVITSDDVSSNMALTKADGIMSAEGLLDNPAVFLKSRYSNDGQINLDQRVPTVVYSAIAPSQEVKNDADSADLQPDEKRKRKLEKKLKEIGKLERKVSKGTTLIDEQKEKLGSKSKIEAKLRKLLATMNDGGAEKSSTKTAPEVKSVLPPTKTTIALRDLYEAGGNKVQLANEYLELVRRYPITMRTVIFHTRRMLKDELTQYQLMDDCVAAKSVEKVQRIVDSVKRYQDNPTQFLFDKEKAAREKEALARRKHEEGKRKRFEDRMKRKAKREGKLDDLEFYLRQGAEVPTTETKNRLNQLSREEQLVEWKKNHTQHCMAYHLDTCKRDRACAFLHVDSKGSNAFVEKDEIAG